MSTYKGKKTNKKFHFVCVYENYNKKDKVDKREFYKLDGTKI